MIHLHNAYCSFIFPLSLPWSGYYESLPQCYLVDKAALIAVRFSKVGLVTTRRVSRRWRLMLSITTTWWTDKLTRLVVSITTQLSLPSIPVSKGLFLVKIWDFGIIIQCVCVCFQVKELVDTIQGTAFEWCFILLCKSIGIFLCVDLNYLKFPFFYYVQRFL